MGHLDDYLRQQIAPRLQPGEQILHMAHVRHPIKFNMASIPAKYEHFLATATDQRLILFKTNAGGVIKGKPKAQNLGELEWWYQELQEVSHGDVGGVGGGKTLYFVPHEPLGPHDGDKRRYDLFPEAVGLDGQGTFYQSFPAWLTEQVAAGAFPMDADRRQRVADYQEDQQAQAEAKRRRAEQKRAERAAMAKKAAPLVVPILLIVLGLVGLGVGGLFLVDALDELGRHEKSVENEEKALTLDQANYDWRSKEGAEPPAGCPEKDLQLPYRSSSYCHGCMRFDEMPSGSREEGWDLFERDGEILLCEPLEAFEEQLAKSKDNLAMDREFLESAQGHRALGMGGAGAGLILLLAGIVLLLRRRKAAKA